MKDAIEILKKINNSGFKAYIVGGYPRDLYLKRKTNDIDICTSATPKDIKTIFKDALVKDSNYGSLTIIYKNKKYEITTFRKETNYFHYRFPKVEYISDLLKDLQRRDFTINTLCIDEDKNTIDMLDGIKDLDNRIIRMVGDPKKRLKEDALRILRAIRFATILDFKIDESLDYYISEYAPLVKKLSYERKKSELDKIFASKNKLYGVSLLKKYHLDEYLEIDLNNVVLSTDIIGIWAQIDKGKYKFNSNEMDTIKKLKELKDKNIMDIELLYRYGLYIASLKASIDGISRNTITSLYNSLPIKSRSDIDIEIEDINKLLGKKSGPYLKGIIKDMEMEILHGRLVNEEKTIKEYILNKYKNI